MKRIAIVLLAGFFLSACDEEKVKFNGQLNLQESWQIKSGRNGTLTAGIYETSAEASRRKVEIRLKSDKEYKFELRTEKKMSLPDNGTFTLPKQKIGKEFTANGTIATTRSKTGDLIKGTEDCEISSCEESLQEDHGSQPPFEPPFPEPPIWEPPPCFPTYGKRYVEYFPIHVARQVELQLVENGKSQPFATFSGINQYTDREYLRKDSCR